MERCQDSLIHRFRMKKLCNRQPSRNLFPASDRYHLCITIASAIPCWPGESCKGIPINNSGAIIKSAVISKYLGDIKVHGITRTIIEDFPCYESVTWIHRIIKSRIIIFFIFSKVTIFKRPYQYKKLLTCCIPLTLHY